MRESGSEYDKFLNYAAIMFLCTILSTNYGKKINFNHVKL